MFDAFKLPVPFDTHFGLLLYPPMLRVAAVPLVALGLVVAASAAPPDAFDDLHARIAAAEAMRQTVRARFVETTTSSLLAKPRVRRGTLIGEKPARMVIRYTSPERKTILMDGNSLMVFEPGRPEPERIDITDIMKKVNHYFTNATPNQLRRAFTIRVFPDTEIPELYQMDLLPRRKQIKQGLERLQIWVTRDSYMLAQMKMTFAGGDSELFTLEDVELNVPIPPHTFDLDPTPGERQ